MDPPVNAKRASSSIYTSYYSQPLKRIANIVLIEGVQDSDPQLNSSIAEFLSHGWFAEANSVYHLPDPCVVILLLPTETPIPLPRNIELREISHKMKQIKLHSEINRYMKDIVMHIRMNSAFRAGLNAKAAADLITAVRQVQKPHILCGNHRTLTPLHRAIAVILEQSYVTPGMIFMMIKKVFGHRILLNQNSRRASRTLKAEDIIMESLRSCGTSDPSQPGLLETPGAEN
ncbi:hypothetical protein K493DRAFT_299258 [Basidiobolus meristosporus CBS 931.73]|uniref:Magnesium chelatase n=1 Tax=Basidiobolus meristosporus CBS 931.73 TaxID=1314790 RepID=A0A1Y1YNN3_9FUNG|nr:hypothetical protein K493DRAFT_299258 [Basidiobolus meristosporus CBS 931.73]|eukprot:ORX99637.1 hypothetical protein K493DRAFT_299258 [Basidiobolus meristosporus CBS 931.73]